LGDEILETVHSNLILFEAAKQLKFHSRRSVPPDSSKRQINVLGNPEIRTAMVVWP
jgi:hypothetical protein